MKNKNNMKLIILVGRHEFPNDLLTKKLQANLTAASEMFKSVIRDNQELSDFLRDFRENKGSITGDDFTRAEPTQVENTDKDFNKVDPTQVDGTDPDFSATNDGYGNVPEFKTTIWNQAAEQPNCTIPEGYVIDLEKTTENELHFKKKEKKLSDYSNAGELMRDNGFPVKKTSAILKIAAVSKFLREPDKIPCFVPCLINDGIIFRNAEKASPLGFTSIKAAEEALNFLGLDIFMDACQ